MLVVYLPAKQHFPAMNAYKIQRTTSTSTAKHPIITATTKDIGTGSDNDNSYDSIVQQFMDVNLRI